MIFIEAIVILLILRFVYQSIQGKSNPLNISKPFGFAILLVGFLVLPPIIKVWMIIIALVYLYFKSTEKSYSKRIKTFFKDSSHAN